jgi:hypothetical protein
MAKVWISLQLGNARDSLTAKNRVTYLDDKLSPADTLSDLSIHLGTSVLCSNRLRSRWSGQGLLA